MLHPHKTCIATVVNKRFVPGFRAMMNSVLTHTKNLSERVICVDLDLEQEDHQACKEIYSNINFVKPHMDNYTKLPEHAKALKCAFYKLDLFKLARDYDRMLFLDSDMVFVQSIQPLLDLIPEVDMSLCYHKGARQYNTGLMLFGKLEHKVYDKIIQLLKKMKRAWLADQSVITQAMKNQTFTSDHLPHKWNMTKRDVLKKKKTDYIGLHYVGKKPWLGGEKGYAKIEKIWHEYSL